MAAATVSNIDIGAAVSDIQALARTARFVHLRFRAG
jgi:hypothetical protein